MTTQTSPKISVLQVNKATVPFNGVQVDITQTIKNNSETGNFVVTDYTDGTYTLRSFKRQGEVKVADYDWSITAPEMDGNVPNVQLKIVSPMFNSDKKLSVEASSVSYGSVKFDADVSRKYGEKFIKASEAIGWITEVIETH